METVKVTKGLITKKIDKKDLQDFVSAGWSEAKQVKDPFVGYVRK